MLKQLIKSFLFFSLSICFASSLLAEEIVQTSAQVEEPSDSEELWDVFPASSSSPTTALDEEKASSVSLPSSPEVVSQSKDEETEKVAPAPPKIRLGQSFVIGKRAKAINANTVTEEKEILKKNQEANALLEQKVVERNQEANALLEQKVAERKPKLQEKRLIVSEEESVVSTPLEKEEPQIIEPKVETFRESTQPVVEEKVTSALPVVESVSSREDEMAKALQGMSGTGTSPQRDIPKPSPAVVLPKPKPVVTSSLSSAKPKSTIQTPQKKTLQMKRKGKRLSRKKLKKKKNHYVEEFFVPPALRVQYESVDVEGLVFVKTPNVDRNTRYSIVTDFKDSILKSRYVPNLNSSEQIESWVEENVEEADFKGVPVKKVTFKGIDGQADKARYWVGHKSYATYEDAVGQIEVVNALVLSEGGLLKTMVEEARKYVRLPEKKAPVEIKSPAQYEKEEKLMLKWLDQLDIGEELFGPFHGTAPGEKLLWQSFGETTWRNTNLEDINFNQQVGFYTNRLVWKGIRFPYNTINPYVEATTSMEAVGVDFKTNLKLWAGLEWRPFETSAFLNNYRPWSLPMLIWLRNYRFFVQYGNRINIKDEIASSDNHDIHWGVQIFYEWGIDLPGISENGRPQNVPDFLRKYSWGEYFGNYRVEHTNFSSEDDFDSVILNSSIILGFRLPGIPLPENPINNELVFMPYMRFEHTNNLAFSFPDQNKYFVAAGIRWMPFRTYKYKQSEWLSKVKVFGEYVGVGKVWHDRQNKEAPHAIRQDWRVGVSFSNRRF